MSVVPHTQLPHVRRWNPFLIPKSAQQTGPGSRGYHLDNQLMKTREFSQDTCVINSKTSINRNRDSPVRKNMLLVNKEELPCGIKVIFPLFKLIFQAT